MKIFLAVVLTGVLFFCTPESYAEVTTPHQLTESERWSDFYQLINQIKNGYGPKEYKKEALGIDVDELAKGYWPQMKEAKDNGEFYSLMIRFVGEFKDGHFRAQIPTTYRAYLGFDVNLVQDKVLIENVNRKKLSKAVFPFERGDELIAIDGRPVQELMEELMPYVHTANPNAIKGFAAYWLIFRPGSKLAVPSGDAVVTLKKMGGNIAQNVTLKWINSGEPFDESIETPIKAMETMLSPLHERPSGFDPTDLSIHGLMPDLRYNIEDSYHCNPTTRIAIPEDATLLIEEPFTAYCHPTSKGNIGYMRIPDYLPKDDDKDGKPDYEKWVENYRWALDKMEKETAGLIIDQDHNCGGDIVMLENVVSLFMDGEFDPLMFQFRASKDMLLECRKWLDEFENPYFIDRDHIGELCDILDTAFNEGRYLTPKTGFYGDKKLKGFNVYTKPVIVLTDYFAGSGGDAFPAMMQGLGRARLLGTATGGLGGHVEQMPALFYSQIRSDMTRSLFFRPDGTPIENIGAIPDILYEITVDDFVNGYKDYQRFYTEELLKMIK